MTWEKTIIALISLAFALILYLLLPFQFSKYKLTVDEKISYGQVFSVLYADLDGDHSPEFIRCKSGLPAPAIVVHDAEHRIISQWNLNGEWVINSEVSVTDFDQDGFRELVVFTFDHDSIWLHIIEPMQQKGTVIRLPVLAAQMYNEKQDWRIYLASPADMNGDDYDDLVFSVISGLTLQPRKLGIYDIKAEKLLIQSLEVGSNIKEPVIVDLDGDGKPEIVGNTHSPNNYGKTPVYISDSCSWLMVYDHELTLKTDPVAYCESPSYLNVLPLKYNNRQYLVSCFRSKGRGINENQLTIWKWEGESLVMMHSRSIGAERTIQLLTVDPDNAGYFYMAEDDAILKLDHALKVVKRIKVDGPLLEKNWFIQDINPEAPELNLFYTSGGDLTIFRSDFRHPVSINLGFYTQKSTISSFTDNRAVHLCIYRGHQSILLTYSRNPLYPFRYVLLLLFFLGYYLIFILLTNIQRRRIEAKQASEREVLRYQLTNVMQQLDPHFMFNALSNISSYYHKGDKDLAQSYLAKMSKLMRSSLENSEKMTISLNEEMQFVQDYLTLERIRIGDQFDFSIEIEKRYLDQIQLPKMLIQNFAENALKHGIRHLNDRKGLIKIYSSLENDYLHIYIEDNGVGRTKAAEIRSFGTGKGLHMVQKMLEIFKQLQKVRIAYEIEDLFDRDETPFGTRVTIRIPIS